MNAATKAPLADLFAGAEIGMLTLLRPGQREQIRVALVRYLGGLA